MVLSGQQFQSRMDPCETCTCEGGHAVRCMAVRCAPPECKLYEMVEGECCKFNCLEPADSPPDQRSNRTDLVPDNTKPGKQVTFCMFFVSLQELLLTVHMDLLISQYITK